MHSLKMKTCYAPGTILGTGDKTQNKTKQNYESSARFYSTVLKA